MKPKPEEQIDPRALGFVAEAYEQARELRAGAGDRIAAALKAPGDAESLERLMESIARGAEDGPSATLARVYRSNWEQEREMERLMGEMLLEHPAWGWLHEVPGVTSTDAARLLARLDVRRAPTPSAFWAYCGLATVPGIRHRCSACGAERTIAADSRGLATHSAPGAESPCPGRFRPLEASASGRVAQPKPGAGERRAYDEEAKRVCFSIATRLRAAGHQYDSYYREQRQVLDVTRPDWPSGRKHMTALRKMEKLFLAHLWIVWREAESLPITEPSPETRADARGSSPWSMIAAPRKRWINRERQAPQLRSIPG